MQGSRGRGPPVAGLGRGPAGRSWVYAYQRGACDGERDAGKPGPARSGDGGEGPEWPWWGAHAYNGACEREEDKRIMNGFSFLIHTQMGLSTVLSFLWDIIAGCKSCFPLLKEK